MQSTLKIKTRVWVTVAVASAIMSVGSAFAVRTFRVAARDARRLVEEHAQLADDSAQVAADVAALARSEQAYLFDAAQSRDGAAWLQRWTEAYNHALERLNALDAAAATPQAVSNLRLVLNAYGREFAKTRRHVAESAGSAVDPETLAAGPLHDAFSAVERQANALPASDRQRTSTDAAGVENRVTAAAALMAVASLLAFGVVLVGLRSFVHRPIAADADSLAGVCNAVARGDFSSRVPNPGDTELGAVGRALNAMLDSTVSLVQSREERDRMQASVMKLLEEVSGVAHGDLTIEAEVTADVTGAVADSFNFMIGQLRQIISQMQHTSRQVAATLADLRASTEKLASGSEEQAAQAVEASVAIEEMAASIHYVSENASSSATVAERARTNAEHGTRAVTRTIEGMKAVRDQVQETAKRIKRLGESSQEIGEIVELIGDIADRTSMLALNASIQAAMAGDAGRGFAVVADEVERLADRATEATKRAAMLVKTTQTEAAEVMAAMEDTTREVINRSNIANEAGVALSEIQGVSNRLAELIQAISDAAQQQARGSEQVAKSMNDMSSVTRTTAASTKQTASAISSLALLVETLNAVVSRFKLPAAHDAAGQPRLVSSR